MPPKTRTHPPINSNRETYTAVTGATYTAKGGDSLIGVNRAGIVTVTLPTTQVRPGRIYSIKDESGAAATNNITVATEGAETIDGAATDVINVNYESKSYYSDGTNWFIIPVAPDAQNTYEAPGLTLGTANAEGTGNSIRSGATILAFDATNPSTQAHSDAAAPGSATVAARRDHKHAMPAEGSGSDISARVYHSVNQSITNATDTALAFDSERWDTDVIHDTVTNNSRLTCKTAGKYIIVGSVRWTSNVTGVRNTFIRLNGTTWLAFNMPDTNQGNVHAITVSTIYDLAVNDYIELMVHQTSGGALNLEATGNYSPEFMMAKVLG
ncbi:MAG: hypothetical protein HQ475_07805 [SAR202 cluster bacterium]|nr:hypothetical protein [SAR202 cluster bacterium]